MKKILITIGLTLNAGLLIGMQPDTSPVQTTDSTTYKKAPHTPIEELPNQPEQKRAPLADHLTGIAPDASTQTLQLLFDNFDQEDSMQTKFRIPIFRWANESIQSSLKGDAQISALVCPVCSKVYMISRCFKTHITKKHPNQKK